MVGYWLPGRAERRLMDGVAVDVELVGLYGEDAEEERVRLKKKIPWHATIQTYNKIALLA